MINVCIAGQICLRHLSTVAVLNDPYKKMLAYIRLDTFGLLYEIINYPYIFRMSEWPLPACFVTGSRVLSISIFAD